MIENDDKVEFNNKLTDAINFLNLNLEQTQQELKHLNIMIECLKESISKIDTDLSMRIASMDSNANLFSPTKKTQKSNDCDNLNIEKESAERKLEAALTKEKLLIDTQSNLNNTINCLKHIEKNNNSNQGKENEDNTHFFNNKDNNVNNMLLGINVLETQENERKRIARDLHDSTVQNMTNVMHKTELCTRLIDIDSVRAKQELQTMIQTIKTTINDMRNIIYDLRPMSIDDLGLVITIERYIKEYNRSKEIEIVLIVSNEIQNVLSIINLTLFRIVQEAINNSIRHGRATKILIELDHKEDSICLTINDNGIGFNQEACIAVGTNILSGFGLSIMRERVLLLAGNIDITSNDKDGTKIFVKVPLRIHKEDYECSRLR